MRTLLVACGNALRGDDGVAHEVLRWVTAPSRSRLVSGVDLPNLQMVTVLQLTPEIAEEIAAFDRVVFIDADAAAEAVTIEPVSGVSRSRLTHVSTPAEIIALSTALFGFGGEALVCRIPAQDFSPSGHLTPDAMQFAKQAASELNDLI